MEPNGAHLVVVHVLSAMGGMPLAKCVGATEWGAAGGMQGSTTDSCAHNEWCTPSSRC